MFDIQIGCDYLGKKSYSNYFIFVAEYTEQAWQEWEE